MNRLSYFLAAVYRGLRRNNLGRDPYYTILGSIAYTAVILLMLLDTISRHYWKSLLPDVAGIQVILGLGFAFALVIIIAYLIPEKKLNTINTAVKDIRLYTLLYKIGLFAIIMVMVSLIGYFM